MEPHQFDDAIRAIGRAPVQRTTTYERVGNASSDARRVSTSRIST
jgi:2-iminoacetate synthase ThiH